MVVWLNCKIMMLGEKQPDILKNTERIIPFTGKKGKKKTGKAKVYC